MELQQYKNVGRVDQVVRFAVAGLLLALSMFGVVVDYTAGLVTGVALFMAVTAAARVCPVLSLVGTSTKGLDAVVARIPYLAQMDWLKQR